MALTVKHHGSNGNPGDFSDYEPRLIPPSEFVIPLSPGVVRQDTAPVKEDPSPHHNDGTEYLRTRKVGNGPGQPPTVTNVEWLDADQNVQKELSGLSVAADVFLDGVTQSSRSDRYDFWTSLLVGKITVTGSSGDDPFMEVGQGGNAKVNSGAGDDTLYLWHSKNVVYNGGAGSDTLMLEHFDGGGAGNPTAGIVVNLKTGAGTNPFGGTLKLSGVENVSGTFNNDLIKGNNVANKFDADAGGLDAGVDKIFGFGGNDTIVIAGSRDGLANANVANGGAGIDTLRMFLDGVKLVNVLDVGNQANNTGVFRGGSFTNFEAFEFFSGNFLPGQKLVFRGSSANEKVLSGSGDDTLLGGGGSDSFDGSVGKDTIDGGGGVDTWTVRGFGDVVVTLNGATIVKVRVNGIAEDGINNIENLSTGFGDDRLTGDAKANQFSGGEGDDILVGGGGNDVLNGGEGNDTLTGGVGKDAFVFDTALNEFGNIDKVVGFSVADDTIRLDNAVFIGIGSSGTLAAGKFHIGADADAPGQRILYNPATGALSYDANGSVGGLDFQETQFATLAKHVALTAADIQLI